MSVQNSDGVKHSATMPAYVENLPTTHNARTQSTNALTISLYSDTPRVMPMITECDARPSSSTNADVAAWM